MKYDDGFVAYLNGQEIGRANAPTRIAWNSQATRSAGEAEARNFTDFDITPFASLLVPGTNILAIQGLNSSELSSEFLLIPELTWRTFAGEIRVDELDFYGGQLQGITRFEGSFQHHAGELSPHAPAQPIPRSCACRLTESTS